MTVWERRILVTIPAVLLTLGLVANDHHWPWWALGEEERLMSRQAVGILGCVSLAAAIVLAAAVVFFEKAIIAAGVPYHFLSYSVLAAALFGVALVCGLNARGTGAGKFALVGGLVLGVVFVGFIVLVLVGFSNQG